MTNNRRLKSVRSKKRFQRPFSRLFEALEAKLPLDASGIASGNDCAPDLDLDAVAIQTAQVDQEITIDLQAQGGFATDVDASGANTGDSIIWQLDPDDNPANATLTADGVFTWTPTATGEFEFIVLAIDNGNPALADAEIFTINVPSGNTAPDLAEVADTNATVGEELVVDFTATDADAGDTLIFQIDPDELAAIGGTIEQTAEGGRLRWTPADSFAGQTIELTAIVVDDGTPPRSDSEKFTVTVGSVVAAAAADSYAFDSSLTELTVSAAEGVLANDGDITLTASILDQPTNGSVAMSADGSFTYTPNSDFRGTDTFTYEAENASGEKSVGMVSIVVNTTPVAVDDAYSIVEDGTLVVEESAGLLVNDSDPDGDAFTAKILMAPTTGELALNENGSFTFTPAANFNGDVTFTYIVDDGALPSPEATVTITVDPMNDAPVGAADTYDTMEEQDLGVSIADGLLANDTDIDGDALAVTLVEPTRSGSLSLSSDGSFVYMPIADFSGADTFTYTLSDGNMTSAEIIVTINVGVVNDVPIANLDSGYMVNEGVVLVVDAANGVLANDTDADGDTLSATLVADAFNGSVVFSSDGSFSYTPDAGFTGIDNFSYRANDGIEDSNLSLVSIEVLDVNQMPVGVTDTYDAVEDTVLSVDANSGVLSNDTDGDGDALTVSIVTPPSEGMVTLNADGAFEYQTSQNSSGTDTFTYQISDGTNQSAEVVVQINVTISNDSPVAVTDLYTVTFDQVLTVDAASGVLANDTDIDDTDLTAMVVTDVQNGTLALNADGSFTYTPTSGFAGSDTFTYQVTDGEATTDAIVSLQVNAANTFALSEAAAVGDVVGTVASSSSSQAVLYQFADDSFASELLLNENDHISGAMDAPLVLIEYLDFACPACAAYHPIVEQLEQDFAGDLLVVRRHLPLESIHPNARAAARVAEAAGQQGKFEEMGDLLFTNQADWAGLSDPSAVFTGYAEQLSLDMTQYTTDVVNTVLNTRITEDANNAASLQLTSTPSFFLNEEILVLPSNATEFSTVVQAELDGLSDGYTIDRSTGQIKVLDADNITDESFNVLATAADGNTETIAVTIDAIAAAAGGVLSSGLVDDALQGQDNWL